MTVWNHSSSYCFEIAKNHMTQLHSTDLIVGASSGIGRSLALALARERRLVALVGRSEERLTRVAA